MIEWLFQLLIGHALADYPLQGEFLAKGKNRHCAVTPPPGQKPNTIWPYCLTAHALIHAGTVWVITGSAVLGFTEFVLHWVIDVLKCENVTNIHVDQWLHIGCKVVYAIILAGSV